ncbi:MAG: hypothetical protein ACM3PY_04230 [Omnitrophica WOR_2 bacterium]
MKASDRQAFWDRLNRQPVSLDHTSTKPEIEPGEIEQFYIPLAETILARSAVGKRLVVAVAGPPGSGKTVFATLLVAVINSLHGEDRAVVVGMDGWHYTNQYLESNEIDLNGQRMLLRKIKGMPETYDFQSIHAFLEKIESEDRVDFPVYSRELHDPVYTGEAVQPWHSIVVFEGNYLLLDETPWNQLQPFLDVRIFLKADRQNLFEGLRQRHSRGGKDPDQIDQQIERVDLPNIDRVLDHLAGADVIVYKADSRRIIKMELKGKMSNSLAFT